MKNLKNILYHHCLSYVNERMMVCHKRMNSIQQDLASETKSSAGDKHETGRAMLHLEREKLGQQLAVIEKEKSILDGLKLTTQHKRIKLGSVVKTNEHHYFVLISAGAVNIDNQTYICISPQSPIGQLLMTKTVGDKITFRENSFTITQVL